MTDCIRGSLRLALLVHLVSASAGAQPANADTALLRELRETNAALLKAEQERDTAAMAFLITPDFTWVRYDGAQFGRDARIGAVLRGRRNPSSQLVLEERARLVAPDVAIALRRLRLMLGAGEQRRERETWETRVYVRSSGHWRVSAQHATVVPDSSAR